MKFLRFLNKTEKMKNWSDLRLKEITIKQYDFYSNYKIILEEILHSD